MRHFSTAGKTLCKYLFSLFAPTRVDNTPLQSISLAAMLLYLIIGTLQAELHLALLVVQ